MASVREITHIPQKNRPTVVKNAASERRLRNEKPSVNTSNMAAWKQETLGIRTSSQNRRLDNEFLKLMSRKRFGRRRRAEMNRTPRVH